MRGPFKAGCVHASPDLQDLYDLSIEAGFAKLTTGMKGYPRAKIHDSHKIIVYRLYGLIAVYKAGTWRYNES